MRRWSSQARKPGTGESVAKFLICGNSAARTRFRADVIEVREQFQLDQKLIEPSAEDIEVAWEAYARGEAASAGVLRQAERRRWHLLHPR